ncbi:MAG TPA: type II toxin-antitoxin system RelE/ParE family toxin [Bacteroidales bacterium]|nr:type II toxin-antitoxin system RelE/ParE family toxin [Bacteroidales bacterium]
MARRKIIWSQLAKIKLFNILDFYTERNKSSVYSKKLYKKFCKELSFLIKQPDIGIVTNVDSIRGLIVDKFILFYEVTPEMIIVHTIWDCRQNPDDLRIQ